MFETDIVTLVLVLFFAAALTYKLSFFKNKTIGFLSLSQITYLIIIPGFIYTFAFSYIQSILARPLNQQIILPDSLLTNIILLSCLFTYGGLAIHSTSKMLSETLKSQKSKAQKMNTFFHLSLSHNLVFAGAILTVVGFTSLELNHIPSDTPNSLFFSIIKGILLGLSLIVGMYWYTTSDDPEYKGRWLDLKTSFLILWIGSIFVLYGIKKTNPALRNFDLLIPTLVGFLIIALLNAVLVLRKLKQGNLRLYFHLGKIKRLLFETKF